MNLRPHKLQAIIWLAVRDSLRKPKDPQLHLFYSEVNNEDLWSMQTTTKSAKISSYLCDDGDADALTQEAARVAKSALKHIKHGETSKDV